MTPAEIAARLTPAQVNSGFCQCPIHTLLPMRLVDLVEPTFLDLRAACDLIGKDTYGKPYWTPETIDHCHPIVQAFARHRRATLAEIGDATDADL